jgi:hypothetical protein
VCQHTLNIYFYIHNQTPHYYLQVRPEERQYYFVIKNKIIIFAAFTPSSCNCVSYFPEFLLVKLDFIFLNFVTACTGHKQVTFSIVSFTRSMKWSQIVVLGELLVLKCPRLVAVTGMVTVIIISQNVKDVGNIC